MQLCLCSNFEDVRQGLHRITEILKSWDIGGDDLLRAEILLAEVLNNVVEHACADLPPSEIDVSLELRGTDLHISVNDRGRAMPEGKLPVAQPGLRGSDCAQFREGGYGWALIRDIASDLHYSRVSGRNTLSMTLQCTEIVMPG